MFSEIYKNKTVLVTGHTGFKGSWLTVWLLKLGAKVVGFSKDIPSNPSMFVELGLQKRIKHIIGDIRDIKHLSEVINNEKPQFVFHLAAQAIVSTSYLEPNETMTTNIVGTMNILEVLRNYSNDCIAVMITSDKCYDNVEWIWGYKETDHMGGKDIYSGSKGAAELVIKSYFHSYFQKGHPVKIVIGRAGNVIGGGDWASDRIVVDCMRAWNEGRSVEIRSPKATRPWQHVMEPLSGYLAVGASVFFNNLLHGEAFNFGPRAEQNHTVINLINMLAAKWGFNDINDAYKITGNIPFHEAGLLKLNCDKALSYLKWESNLVYPETIQMVSEWYLGFYKNKLDMYKFTLKQITEYEELGLARDRMWSKKNT
jgi:CDP-glucose 4,6-dehydratase